LSIRFLSMFSRMVLQQRGNGEVSAVRAGISSNQQGWPSALRRAEGAATAHRNCLCGGLALGTRRGRPPCCFLWHVSRLGATTGALAACETCACIVWLTSWLCGAAGVEDDHLGAGAKPATLMPARIAPARQR
jgi:hypothetical protein